jgi:hypothetical protein
MIHKHPKISLIQVSDTKALKHDCKVWVTGVKLLVFWTADDRSTVKKNGSLTLNQDFSLNYN